MCLVVFLIIQDCHRIKHGKVLPYYRNNYTIGHSVTLHGCSISDNSLIGIGSVVLDQCEIGEWSIIAAGSMVKPNTKVPSGKLWGGLPAKQIRDINDNEREWIKELSNNYVELSKQYLS